MFRCMEDVKQLIVSNVPVSLHRKYKTYCHLNGLSMAEDIKRYMETACAGTIIQQASSGETTIFSSGSKTEE